MALSRHPLAARDVPVGMSWAFLDHRTMGEIEAMESATLERAESANLNTPPCPSKETPQEILQRCVEAVLQDFRTGDYGSDAIEACDGKARINRFNLIRLRDAKAKLDIAEGRKPSGRYSNAV